MDPAVFNTVRNYVIRMMCSDLFVDLGEKCARKYIPPPAPFSVPIPVQPQSSYPV